MPPHRAAPAASEGGPSAVDAAAGRESLWRKWGAQSPRQRILLTRAGMWLPVFSLAVQVVPLRRIVSVLGLEQVNLDGPTAPGVAEPNASAPRVVDSARAVEVARALSVVAGRLPWTSTCLAQALTGARLLHSDGLQASVTLGVAKGSAAEPLGDPVLAHAWLEHGGVTVTGAQERRYQPVGRFFG